ncbi:MAG: hypothetical protein KAT28_05585 [Candidatus Aenigmarchaeota archaeon]|nr:hypothetical protein [Candidatus Aenigmarchaeota archaeon]
MKGDIHVKPIIWVLMFLVILTVFLLLLTGGIVPIVDSLAESLSSALLIYIPIMS